MLSADGSKESLCAKSATRMSNPPSPEESVGTLKADRWLEGRFVKRRVRDACKRLYTPPPSA